MKRHNTPSCDTPGAEPIHAGMKSSRAYLVLSLAGGLPLTLLAVIMWTAWAAFAAAAIAAIYAIVCIQALRRVRDLRLPYAEHMRHENDLLAAATFAVLSATLSWMSGLSILGVGPVMVSVLGTLPGFALYMYLIFGVTRHGEQTVYDFFIKQPQAVVESGLAPIKAAGEAQRAKDKQGEQ